APGIISLCAPVNITAQAGSGAAGFTDLIAEAGHGDSPGFIFGPASLCVVDKGPARPEQIRFRISRVGVGQTATFADIAEDLQWNHVFFGDLGVRVYDYSTATFDVQALMNQSGMLPMTGRVRVLDSTGQTLYYQGLLSGTMSFSFVGHI